MKLAALTLRLNDLRNRFQRLSARERLLVGMLAGTLGVLVVLGLGFAVVGRIGDLEESNQAMRQALRDIAQNRETYLRAKGKAAQLEFRIGRGNVQLQGFLETMAKEAGVEIAETVERQPAAAGKKYLERTVDVRLRKVGLEPLAKFLRKVETGPNLVVVTSLSVRSRDDKHEELEVEMIVSTYEHAPEGKPAHRSKG